MAILLGALYRSHQDFVITVIDDLLENINLGLEQNDFKINQRRLAEVRYLGELYNYKMVDSSVIFDTLYRLITFGHRKYSDPHGLSLCLLAAAGGTPSIDKLNPLDMPDDFFRLRLVCIVLDACGNCYERGAAKKKLDFFLTFFQVRFENSVTLIRA